MKAMISTYKGEQKVIHTRKQSARDLLLKCEVKRDARCVTTYEGRREKEMAYRGQNGILFECIK